MFVPVLIGLECFVSIQQGKTHDQIAPAYIGKFAFFTVIDTRNRGLALSHNMVIHDVVGEDAVLCLI
jgi:hypothetical protein